MREVRLLYSLYEYRGTDRHRPGEASAVPSSASVYVPVLYLCTGLTIHRKVLAREWVAHRAVRSCESTTKYTSLR